MNRFGIVALLVALTGGAGPADVAPVPPEGTLLVAGMGDDSVWLIDLPSGERRFVVHTRVAPHEIAVSADGRTAVVMNYGDQRGPGNLIQVVDVERGTVTSEIEVDGFERLHGAAFLAGDTLLAITSERTSEILVLGFPDGAIRHRLSTGGRMPHMLALGGGWLYAANLGDGSVARIDPAGNAPASVWPAGNQTEGVAATPDGREVWTGSREGGEVVGVEGASGKVVARVSGVELPYRLACTPDGATIVVSDPSAQALVLIDRAGGRIRQRIDIGAASVAAGLGADPSPQGFTLSRDGNWAFVATKGIDRVAMIDLRTAEVAGFLPTGSGPDGIAFSPARVRP